MPTRRNAKYSSDDPEALAQGLPDDLRTFVVSTDSRDFGAHARHIAEWLNTQHPGLGYLTPEVMRAAGQTASAWFKAVLLVVVEPEG